MIALEPYQDPRRICGVRNTYFMRYLFLSKIVFDAGFLIADLIVWNDVKDMNDRILGPVLWGLNILVSLYGVFVSFVPSRAKSLFLAFCVGIDFLLGVAMGVWRVAQYSRGSVDTYLQGPSIGWLVAWVVSGGITLAIVIYFYGLFLGPSSPDSHEFGVGLRLIKVAEGFKIEHCIIGGPAWSSGVIFPGDVIVSVDGTNIQRLEKISPLLWGPAGSQVTLGIWRYPLPLSQIMYITLVRGPVLPVPADVQAAATASAMGHYPVTADPNINVVVAPPSSSPPPQLRQSPSIHEDSVTIDMPSTMPPAIKFADDAILPQNRSQDIAEALVELGKTYAQHGRLKEAAGVLERALQTRQQAYGATDARTARVASKLGAIYRQLGRHEEGGKLLIAALKALVMSLGSSHPDVGKAALNLGMVYEEQGQLVDAEAAYTDSVAVFRSSLSSVNLPGYETKLHRLAAKAIAALFHLCVKIGKLCEADAAVRRTDRQRGLYQDDMYNDVDLATSPHLEVTKLAEAEEAYLRALNLQGLHGIRIGYTDGTTPGWVDIPHLQEMDIGEALHALGNVYRKQNRLSEAEDMLQRAIRVLGASAAVHGRDEDNQALAFAISDLAMVDKRAGRYLEAEQGFERAMTLFQRLKSNTAISSHIESTAAALQSVRNAMIARNPAAMSARFR